MNILPVLPILVPLLTAAGCLLFWRRRQVQRLLALAGAAALQVSALGLLAAVWQDGILTVQMGNWPAPFGITLAADLLSVAMVNLSALLGLAVTIYSLTSIDPRRETFHYYPLLQVLLAAVQGVFLTGDIFNLYVWFEVMLMASFVLMALGGERAQLEGTVKYLLLNLLSSTLFLAAVGLLYGAAGTLNLAQLATLAQGDIPRQLLITLSLLFLAAFGIKGAIFPLFFWLPPSYPTPPFAVSALFAGLLTKVGVYAMVRFFTLLVLPDADFIQPLLLFLAGLTMLTGVLGAVAQNEFRRILSIHIISQVGYLIMGLGLFSTLALTGAIYFFIHITIVKANLFLVSGVVHRLRGRLQLAELGGLAESAPWLSVIFFLSALSLAGVPPLSGFWAKFTLVRAGLESGHYIVAATAIVVGLLTLFSMTKIWGKAFRGEPPAPAASAVGAAPAFPAMLGWYLPMTALVVLTVLIGVLAEPVLVYAERAARQLVEPRIYIEAVLGALL